MREPHYVGGFIRDGIVHLCNGTIGAKIIRFTDIPRFFFTEGGRAQLLHRLQEPFGDGATVEFESIVGTGHPVHFLIFAKIIRSDVNRWVGHSEEELNLLSNYRRVHTADDFHPGENFHVQFVEETEFGAVNEWIDDLM